jgi:hypothetical protein
MSKIMRQIYAEARAAREAAAKPIANASNSTPMANALASSKIEPWTVPLPDPARSADSTIDWWTTQYERAARDIRASTSARGDDSAKMDICKSDAWVRAQTARIAMRHQQFGQRCRLDIDALLSRIAR